MTPSRRTAAPRDSWVGTEPGLPYFVCADGTPWTPVGQNDAISWVELRGLYRGRDLPEVERHLRRLRASGVTCLRLMLEYAQGRRFYFEKPQGRPVPHMVALWDDLFRLCEATGLKILLTPFDTFWTWLQWEHHPYNRRHGGPLETPSRFLLDRATRDAIKGRFAFAIERWGGSDALFAWDLWNEIHPAQAEDSADAFNEFIHDLATFVRATELRLHGRAHPRTVSLFGPELWWRPAMDLRTPIFRHPDLDFASIHLYHEGTIDAPRDTVEPALSTGRIVRDAIAEIADGRPFLDSEHGPIHTFKDKRRNLPEAFDDEYFRHMQWAHLASGGAGGGMRWPNRKPHVLTPGMRQAQGALSAFLPLLDWTRFRRRNLNEEARALSSDFAVFACGDDGQAVLWLLRTDTIGPDGLLRRDAPARPTWIRVPGLAPGRYELTGWDTREGRVIWTMAADHAGGALSVAVPPVATDVAIAARRLGESGLRS